MAHPFLKKTDDNPFKDDRNQWRTRNLFFEFKTKKEKPVFTIKDNDYNGYTSLKKLYISYPHIPGFEYDFATTELGGWEHWLILQESTVLKPIIQSWKDELDIKLKASALREIVAVAKDEKHTQQLSAARYLADKGYIPKSSPSRGRPSKEERAAKLKEDTEIRNEFDDDLRRLGLIKGGRS